MGPRGGPDLAPTCGAGRRSENCRPEGTPGEPQGSSRAALGASGGPFGVPNGTSGGPRDQLAYPSSVGTEGLPASGSAKASPGRSSRDRMDWACRACQVNRRRDDPLHTRDPDGCKYPLDEAVQWSCPGCKSRLANTDPRHTRVPGECKTTTITPRARVGAPKHAPRPSRPGPLERDLRPPRPEPVADPTEVMRPGGAPPDSHDAALEELMGGPAEPGDPPPELTLGARDAHDATAATGSGASFGREPATAAASSAGATSGRAPHATASGEGSSHAGGRKPAGVDAEVQAETEAAGWMAFDLGRAIKLLHLPDAGIVRRTLRRLHVRFWHAPAKRLAELLQRAGAPAAAIKQVAEIVESCRTCRMWTRPGPKSATTTRLATGFNLMVQWDILFHRLDMISHLLDEAIRWTVANHLPDKTATSIITDIQTHWVKAYGPMKCLVADQERGLLSEEAAQWMDRQQIEMKDKEPGAHAQMVERHHDILRKLLLRVEEQLQTEGVNVPKEMILAEAVLAKNLLLSVGGVCPYQALYGRMPPIMAEFEPLSETMLDDESAGIPGISRHSQRLREVAVQSMVDLTAKQRIERAAKSKTRKPAEAMKLEQGDLVDFHRPPISKDDSGWRGPATVVEVDGGQITLRWQQRCMQARAQDVRRALVHFALLAMLTTGSWPRTSPAHTLTAFADGLVKQVIRVGWIKHEGWRRAEANRSSSEVLIAALHVAACGLHLVGCIGARIGHGVSVLEGVAECDWSFLWWWRAGHTEVTYYHETPATSRLRLVEIFGPAEWPTTSFVQFLTTSVEDVQELRRQEPQVPNIGGPHDPDVQMPWVPDGLPVPVTPAVPPAPSPAAEAIMLPVPRTPSTPSTPRSRSSGGRGRSHADRMGSWTPTSRRTAPPTPTPPTVDRKRQLSGASFGRDQPEQPEKPATRRRYGTPEESAATSGHPASSSTDVAPGASATAAPASAPTLPTADDDDDDDDDDATQYYPPEGEDSHERRT